ncbi:MAG: UbiX family flavin prenyltransferase [Gammaproteobacteria bacterium]|nr:UbiX family flavin prenyltransferase [Gammaproteobacteria bacterium]MDH5777024.1 UbiX family flavin prenyltransferase [Gammaproteobacteria bacterium]
MTTELSDRPIILALTGASGSAYGLRLLECLLRAEQNVYLLVSKAAQLVLATETDLDIPARPAEMQKFFCQHYQVDENLLQVFSREDWMSPVASGSHRARAMVVCPCTTGTLAGIAMGSSDNLIERAADVMLKEQRKLILVPRETPLSAIHLENMLKLSRIGVTILPANPGFYHKPTSVNELVDFIVARILDQLDLEHALVPRWGEQG